MITVKDLLNKGVSSTVVVAPTAKVPDVADSVVQAWVFAPVQLIGTPPVFWSV